MIVPRSKRSPLRSTLVCTAWAVVAASGCHVRTPAKKPAVPESAEACQARQTAFTAFVAALPERAVASPTRVDLPESGLGAIPGPGSVLEIAPTEVALDGDVFAAQRLEERVARFKEWVAAGRLGGATRDAAGSGAASKSSPAGSAQKAVLYVAASQDTDVQTLRAFLVHVPEALELRLLVRAPSFAGAAFSGEPSARSRELAARILTERDAAKRKQLAGEGYGAFADCSAVAAAVSSVNSKDAVERWPALKTALHDALPSCDCRKLDTASLQALVTAEQRAGAASLGFIPLGFVKDERCDATMPLRSVKKLVHQMEQFDEDFAGGWQKDAMHFEDVLASDRLGVFFCDALPGETLAAKERARATVYFRLPGQASCDAWTFEPLATGSPMGTFRRVAGTGRSPLAVHYWQASEELRLFGPVDLASPSRPTDTREWACDENVKLTGVDPGSIVLDSGRWFHSKDACQSSPADSARATGCFSALAAGLPLPPKAPPRGEP